MTNPPPRDGVCSSEFFIVSGPLERDFPGVKVINRLGARSSDSAYSGRMSRPTARHRGGVRGRQLSRGRRLPAVFGAFKDLGARCHEAAVDQHRFIGIKTSPSAGNSRAGREANALMPRRCAKDKDSASSTSGNR